MSITLDLLWPMVAPRMAASCWPKSGSLSQDVAQVIARGLISQQAPSRLHGNPQPVAEMS